MAGVTERTGDRLKVLPVLRLVYAPSVVSPANGHQVVVCSAATTCWEKPYALAHWLTGQLDVRSFAIATF
jgi:hypothetical protein